MECMSKSIQTTLNHSRDNQASKRKKLVHRKNWARKNWMKWTEFCVSVNKKVMKTTATKKKEKKKGVLVHISISLHLALLLLSLSNLMPSQSWSISLFFDSRYMCACVRVYVWTYVACIGVAQRNVPLTRREKKRFFTHMWCDCAFKSIEVSYWNSLSNSMQ